MGASNFTAAAYGKSPEEAFSRAVQEARHEYGHGGYTGTIAEKPSAYILPALPPRWTAAKVEALIATVEYGESYKAANGEWKIRKGSAEKAAATLNEWLRSARSFRTAADLVEMFNDKWGACLCVEVKPAEAKRFAPWLDRKRGERAFVFFGLASE